MAERSTLPPLSGEIMTGPARREETWRVEDAVDAEYEIVRPDAADARPATAARPLPDAPAGMDMLNRRAAPAPRFQPAGWGFWAGGVALAAAAFWVAGGHSLVTRAIDAQEPSDTLRVALLSSHVAQNGARRQIVVDGALDNPAQRASALPDVLIHVVAQDGATTRYRVSSGGGEIEPGGLWRFSSRVDAPPAGVRSISVTIDGGEG